MVSLTALVQNAANAALDGNKAEMLIPPVFVAGFAVPLPFQFPVAFLNQPVLLVKSMAIPISVPDEIEPRLDPVLEPLNQMLPLGKTRKLLAPEIPIDENTAPAVAMPIPESEPVHEAPTRYSIYNFPALREVVERTPSRDDTVADAVRLPFDRLMPEL